MSKLRKMLDDFMNSIREKDFRDNKETIEEKSAPKKSSVRSNPSPSFQENKELVEDDPHRSFWANRSKDPYQDEVDKINQNIKDAKGLTAEDMKEIDMSLAQQDIQKDIYRQEMNMASTEAMEKQAAWTKAQEDKEKERKKSLREKFLGKNEQDHERER